MRQVLAFSLIVSASQVSLRSIIILDILSCTARCHPCQKWSEQICSISQHVLFSASKCQVTSMCTQNDNLYVGTTLGCLIVLNKHLLLPLSIVQCNTSEQPIDLLLPLSFTLPQIQDVDTLSMSSTGARRVLIMY